MTKVILATSAEIVITTVERQFQNLCQDLCDFLAPYLDYTCIYVYTHGHRSK